jgi:membrane protein required for colicin V production
MNFFDLIFSVILIGFLVISFFRGFFKELLSSLGVVAGYLAAEAFHERYWHLVQPILQNVDQAKMITYFGIFAIGNLLGGLLSIFFRLFYPGGQPSFFSRIPGGFLGLLKATVICLVIFHIVMQYIPSFSDDLQASFFFPWFLYLKNLAGGINLAY